MKKTLAILCSAMLLQACTVQTLFDNLGAKDKESRRAERDIAFGPDPLQKLDVYVPLNSTGKDPVLMFIYGGSWEYGDKDGYDFAGRAFAARGFVTVIADYRKVPDVVFPGFVEDGAMAVKWITENISKYGGDPSRIYLTGHSAGGYNAMMLAVDRDFLAAHNLNGDTVDAVAGISGPYDFYPFDVPASINAFGHVEDPIETTQPIAIADELAPPMLLLTGTDDTTVYPRNVRALAKVAAENGTEIETRFYEGLDHVEPVTALSITFRKKAPVLDDITGFFKKIDARVLAGRAEGSASAD